jgi:Fe-S cluster assembly iron-binding protein IscA
VPADEETTMLRISEGAAQGIRGLLAAVSPDDRRAIRISGGRESDAGDYELTPAPAPTPGDRTVDQNGVQVFVDPAAAPRLDDKLLDARVRQGSLRFAVEDGGGGPQGRTEDDRRRFADERRRVEDPDKPARGEEEPDAGPDEDAVRETQRRRSDQPGEAD